METRKIEAQYYCGVDMHARSSYICVVNRVGDIELCRNIPNDFKIFKEFMRSFVSRIDS